MSILSTDCLQYAIGLSRTGCACHTTGMPTDADKSDSDLFLFETDGLQLKLAEAISDCENGNIWQIGQWAKEEAIKSVRNDIIALIAQGTDPILPAFNGYVGETTARSTISTAFLGAYLRWLCKPIRGGYFRLKRIGLLFDTSATFNIGLFSSLQTDDLAVYEVTTIANKLAWYTLPEPIDLPMYDKGCRYVHYELAYIRDGFTAKDNQVGCGCGGASVYSQHDPSYGESKDAWSHWILATGGQGTDFNDRDNWSFNREANGLILDAEIFCDAQSTICKDKINYAANPYSYMLAWAIRFRAAQLVCGRILSSNDPDRYTMAGREQMASNFESYSNQANSRIVSLGEIYSDPKNINLYNDCFKCRPALGYSKNSLIRHR